MPIQAWELPDHVQGFRFSRDDFAYDRKLMQFIDLAGYGELRGNITHTNVPRIKAGAYFQNTTELNANLLFSASSKAYVASTDSMYIKSGAYGTGSWALYLQWYRTKAVMDADLVPGAGVFGLVWNDPTEANNKLYVKSGASGAGSWAADTSTPTWTTNGGNSKEGLKIDGTSFWDMPPSALYEGTRVIIMKTTFPGSNGTWYPMQWAEVGSTYCQLKFVRSSGPAHKITFGNQGGTALAQEISGFTSGNITIFSMATEQLTRKNHVKIKTGTTTSSAAISGTTSGQGIALSAAKLEDGRDANIRIGAGSSTAYIDLLEYHTFDNPRLLTTETKEFDEWLAAKIAEYAVP